LVRWAAVESVKTLSPRSTVGAFKARVQERRGKNIGTVAAARKQIEFVFYALRDHHIRALHPPAPERPSAGEPREEVDLFLQVIDETTQRLDACRVRARQWYPVQQIIAIDSEKVAHQQSTWWSTSGPTGSSTGPPTHLGVEHLGDRPARQPARRDQGLHRPACRGPAARARLRHLQRRAACTQ